MLPAMSAAAQTLGLALIVALLLLALLAYVALGSAVHAPDVPPIVTLDVL